MNRSDEKPPVRRGPGARLLEGSLKLAVIAVIGLLAAAVVAFVWALAKTWTVVRTLVEQGASSDLALVDLLEVLDTYLVASVLLIMAVGLYELFVGDLELPGWLEIRSINDLKAKLADVLILVFAVKFLEKLLTAKDPLDVVWFGLGIVLVGGLLFAYRVWGGDH